MQKRTAIYLIILLAYPALLLSQDVQVEYDKNRDISGYNTFRFGDSEIVTTKGSKKISDKSLDQIIREELTRELKEKGLTYDPENGQLVATYMYGQFRHSQQDAGANLSLIPGQGLSNPGGLTRAYTQGSLVIDLNDSKSEALIWRVNSTANPNGPEARKVVDQVISKGFKKFNEKPKKSRR
jgi:hypothetical protein